MKNYIRKIILNSKLWMYYNSPVYINTFNFKKVLNTYLKCRKIWKRPVLKFSSYYKTYTPCFRLFELRISDVEYKIKEYDNYDFEHEPYIGINICGVQFNIELHAPATEFFGDDDIYYESMLYYIANQNIYETYKLCCYTDFYMNNGEQCERYHTITPYLKRGWKDYLLRCCKVYNETFKG